MSGTTTKKGFFGALKDVFVEEVPDQTAAASNTSTMPAPPTSPPPANNSSLEPVRIAVNQQARKELESAIAQSAPPGYVEITDTISELADSIPDEASRIRAALKLAKKRGHSVDDILGDMDKCIGILESKGREFQDETKRQIDKKIGARQTQVQTLDQTVKTKQEQIVQLQKEVTSLMEERATVASSITTETARIQTVSDGFEVVYDAVMEQLVDRRKKIEMFGKVGQS